MITAILANGEPLILTDMDIFGIRKVLAPDGVGPAFSECRIVHLGEQTKLKPGTHNFHVYGWLDLESADFLRTRWSCSDLVDIHFDATEPGGERKQTWGYIKPQRTYASIEEAIASMEVSNG